MIVRTSQNRRRIVLLVLLVCLALCCFAFVPAGAKEGEGQTGQESILAGVEELLASLDTGKLQEYLDSLTQEQQDAFGGSIGEKIRSLLSGDFALDYGSALSAVWGMLFEGLTGLLPAFCTVCAVAILCGLLVRFRSSFAENGTVRVIGFVGYAAILVLVLSSLTGIVSDCASAVGSMQRQMQAVFPLLLTLIATSGGSVSVAVYQPAVLCLSEVIVGVVSGVVFPLASLICVLHMAGGMNAELRLRNFSQLFASVIKWVLGISLTAFTVFLTVQGITSATYDGLSFKAAKYALSNSVPIVGGFLGSGFDLVVAGSVLIKNSLGSCGIFLLVIVLASPLIQLAVYTLFLKLSAAVIEPVGDAGTADLLTSLAGALNYFTAGLLAVGFMYFITMLLLICSSNALF